MNQKGLRNKKVISPQPQTTTITAYLTVLLSAAGPSGEEQFCKD
jgi:hypothetical protein